MLYGTRRLNVTNDGFGSFGLIPYLANVEYNDRGVVLGFFDGDGRSKEWVDRTASSKF
jgi:hypothetical protein